MVKKLNKVIWSCLNEKTCARKRLWAQTEVKLRNLTENLAAVDNKKDQFMTGNSYDGLNVNDEYNNFSEFPYRPDLPFISEN